MEKLSVEAVFLWLEERRSLGDEVASPAHEPGLDDEHLLGGGNQLALLVEGLPVLHERETVREGPRIFREQALLDDLRLIKEERAKPCRHEEHGYRGRRSAHKSVCAVSDCAVSLNASSGGAVSWEPPCGGPAARRVAGCRVP